MTNYRILVRRLDKIMEVYYTLDEKKARDYYAEMLAKYDGSYDVSLVKYNL